jgi:fructose-bisphosphate aldolase, class I
MYMRTDNLATIAQTIVADGKGILAADETVRTVTKRLGALDIDSTADSRRAYREMFFTTPGCAEFISGVILHDETIRQSSSTGTPFVDVLAQQRIIPGIKVDTGAKPLAGFPQETITEGLDGLRERLDEYRRLGAGFAKWRAVIAVTEKLPSTACVAANAHALARYAALCQEQDLLPIVEPEVLMSGSHTIERCEEVTGNVLHAVFEELFDQKVSLEGMLLKPSMVIAGESCPSQATVEDVARMTLRCLLRHVPCTVPGIVFLSGGQSHQLATRHLNAINQLDRPTPWKLTFSYGRALQDEALRAWHGSSESLEAGQRAFHHRALCDRAAAMGQYTAAMEGTSAAA